ncbi:hypothetical protein BY458DRAFT_524807 [Sporodiniella umbellata]|nr:hypothetical protein BY458DRAFT_524807 [Sporodiniella umbellata]
MRLFFLNNQQHSSDEKNKPSFKKTVYNLISRNNKASQAAKPNSSATPKQKQKPNCIPNTSSKLMVCQRPHWKEVCTAVTEQQNKLQCPAYFLTHSHLRSTRSNPNQLMLIAASNGSKTPVAYCKVIKKRSDNFIWGKQSPLICEI